jgi:hypothetical protein
MEAGFLADVNSMYPAQLATVPMPIGPAEDSHHPQADYVRGRAGIYQADVSVPALFIPPLPMHVRDRQRVQRIAYPTGHFTGTWTGLELRWAETVGAKIRRIHRAITWPRQEIIFDGFIGKLFKLRATAGKKTWLGKWLKLFMNSLTGKFAMQPARHRYLFHPELESIKPWDKERCARYCRSKTCSGRCGAHVELSPGIWRASTYFVQPCAHVEWAAHLTAGARITIGAHLTTMGEGSAYTDTDSVFSVKKAKRLGLALGQLEDKGTVTNFHALAPKVYTYDEEDGTHVYAAKGISDPGPRWSRISAGETVESRRIRGFVTGARRGDFFKRDEIKRTVKLAVAREGAYGDRVLDGNLTRPRDIEEFLA